MSDEAMGDTQRCPQCGAEFVPAASPLGLCPACLLKLGASDPAMKPLSVEPDPLPPVSVAAATPAAERRPWRRVTIVAATVVLLIATVLLLRTVRRTQTPTLSALSNVIRFDLPWPDGTDPDGAQFAVSPDGLGIALAARGGDGHTRLWLRTLQSMDWRPMPRTEGATHPFWSPDSRRAGFFADRKLKTIDVSNGLTRALCDAPSGRGGTWSREGVIVFAPAGSGPLFRISASGGAPQPVTTLDTSAGESAHVWPQFLPDGRKLLLAVTAGRGRATSAAPATGGQSLHLASLDSNERTMVVEGGSAGAFAQGFLLFVRGSQLLAQRFDPDSARLVAEARPISGPEQVADAVTRSLGFSVSDNGLLMHRVGVSTQSQLIWFDRSGEMMGPAADAGEYQRFSLSPDNRRIAVARREPGDSMASIWLIEIDRQVTSRLTSGASPGSSPAWLPDADRVVFASRRDGGGAVYASHANSGSEQLLYRSDENLLLEDASPDLRFLLFASESSETGADLWVLPLDADRKNGGDKPTPLLRTPFNESQGRVSPDGRWIAYVSDESGRDEVYVRPFPKADGLWQISTEGGRHPRWRRDGRELFFVSAEARLQSVDVQAGAALRSGRVRTLFQLPRSDEFEAAADGHRFLVRTRVEDPNHGRLQVVVNWKEELGRER